MERHEFLKLAKTVDVVLWARFIRANDNFWSICNESGELATFDTHEEAVTYCEKNHLTYIDGVHC